jgi:hypothetical protein
MNQDIFEKIDDIRRNTNARRNYKLISISINDIFLSIKFTRFKRAALNLNCNRTSKFRIVAMFITFNIQYAPCRSFR